ncbi:MAG: hypothetical protein HFG54_14930 [Lachnospiraceae bacterium]|jgi:hypothetical protein|nr:hypothetical protein [Lachnospiraceae bacterium]
MIKSKFVGYTLQMKLPKEYGYNGYSVECRYQYIKSQEKYFLSMWIKRDDKDDKFKIESQKINRLPISGTKDTIVDNICRIVEQACISGYFDSYIQLMEYTYQCFRQGEKLLKNKKTKQEGKGDGSIA